MDIKDLSREILDTRSFTIIDRLIENALESDGYLLEEQKVLKEILNASALDERYAICHEQLGQAEKAKALRDFMKARINRTNSAIDQAAGITERRKGTQEEATALGLGELLDTTHYHQIYSIPFRLAVPGPVHAVFHKDYQTIHRIFSFQYVLVTGYKRAICLYFPPSLSAELTDNDFLVAARHAHQRGWKKAILRQDDFLGETIELMNLSGFLESGMGRNGVRIFIRAPHSYQTTF